MGLKKTDLDYENYVTGLKESIETYTIENPKAVGHTSAYLNPYLNPEHSYFIGGRGDGEWEIVNLLSSIGTGRKILREIIETAEKKTLIDGVQSYLVKPIN